MRRNEFAVCISKAQPLLDVYALKTGPVIPQRRLEFRQQLLGHGGGQPVLMQSRDDRVLLFDVRFSLTHMPLFHLQSGLGSSGVASVHGL